MNEIYDALDRTKASKGLVDTEYLKLKARLANNHEYSAAFKKGEK